MQESLMRRLCGRIENFDAFESSGNRKVYVRSTYVVSIPYQFLFFEISYTRPKYRVSKKKTGAM